MTGKLTKAKLQEYYTEVLTRANETAMVIPAHRKAFKKGYSFSGEPFETQLAIWDHIWKQSSGFRTRLHAFLFLDQYAGKKEVLGHLWQTSAAWQNDVNDWGLCDALAKINTKALEVYPKEVYTQLAAWNKDADQWKRRQSVVSLLYFSRTKKAYLPFAQIADLVAPLLTDKEYYVQKGIGWALREMHTVYPADTQPFLRDYIRKISAIAFTIAIEKMTNDQKNALKAMRKK